MAEDGSRRLWITREVNGGWSVWCKVGSANLSLASSNTERLTFETPEQCVALFRNHSRIEPEWNDFIERIQAHDRPGEPHVLDASLSDEKKWIGPGESTA
jgi:hypothetical protein